MCHLGSAILNYYNTDNTEIEKFTPHFDIIFPYNMYTFYMRYYVLDIFQQMSMFIQSIFILQ